MSWTPSPKLIARFETDEQGNPRFIKDAEKKHYKLVFEIENAPSDVYAATFELHESYYDPIRTLRPDDHGRLLLKTTSYGDYELKIHLRTKEGEAIQFVDNLADALQRARPSMPSNPTIDKAISEIAGS